MRSPALTIGGFLGLASCASGQPLIAVSVVDVHLADGAPRAARPQTETTGQLDRSFPIVSLMPVQEAKCRELRQAIVRVGWAESGRGVTLSPVGELRCGRLPEGAAVRFSLELDTNYCNTVKAFAQEGTGLLELHVFSAENGSAMLQDGPSARVSMRPEAGSCVRIPLEGTFPIDVEVRAVSGSPIVTILPFRY